MNVRSLPTFVQRTYDSAKKHGATIPANIRKDLDAHIAVIDMAENTNFTGQTIAAAVTAALAAGRDPVTDPAVHEAITRDRIQSSATITQVVETSTYALQTEVLTHLDSIVEAFKPAYNTAAEQYTEAYERLTAAGVTNLEDTIGTTLDMARANIDAREAEATMNSIRMTLVTLIGAAGRANGTPLGHIVDQIDTGDTDPLEVIISLGRHWTLWDALTAGYTITLATPTEADERAARAYEAQSN